MTTERERFEAWLEAVRDKADPGDWLFSKREAAWKAWQAALSAPPDTENRRAQPAAPADAAPSVAPEPVAWTLQSELDAAQTTCSAHLWFTNPRNSAWTALFTREQIAAHPPRAPLTEEQRRDLVKECGLDWQRGYMPLFEGDPTNRYAVLVEAVEAAHGIGGK